MSKSPTWDICPYTRCNLGNIQQLSCEHVFLDCIGGTLDFAFKCEKKANEELGRQLDAALLRDPLIMLKKVHFGIKSASGACSATFKGKTDKGEVRVEVTFRPQGDLDLRIINPLQLDDAGKKGVFYQLDQHSRGQFEAYLTKSQKRGRQVHITAKNPFGELKVALEHDWDFSAIQRCLAKMAYAAVYKFLGDEWLEDEGSTRLYKFFSEDAIPDGGGGAFGTKELFEKLLPTLQLHQHGAVLMPMHGRLWIMLTLFGHSIHTFACPISTNLFGFSKIDGKVVICDTIARRTEVMTLLDYVSSINIPPIKEQRG